MSMQENQLPIGWEIKKLGEICSYEKKPHSKSPLPYIGLEDIESNTGRFLGSLNPQKVKSQTFGFLSSHILYGRLRPYLNKVLLPDFDGHCSTEIFPIATTKQVHKRFLFYWLMWDDVVKKIDATWTGARMPRANMNAVLGFDIVLPPYAEQKRIVAILDEAFAAIDKAKANLERNLQNAKELFETYLEKVFADGGDDLIQEKMVEVCNVITCGVASTPKYVSESVGVPFLSAQNVKNGEVILTKYNFISKEFHQQLTKKNKPTKGDILYSRVGAKFGEAGVVEHDFDFSVYVSLTLIRTIPDKLNNYYLKYYLNSPLIKSIAKKSISSSGVPNLNVNDVREFPISYPSLKKQEQIIKEIESFSLEIKKLEAIYQQKLTALAELKKSILQKAFAGELTASQSKMYPVPPMAKVVSLSPTDTHAAIISLALRKHNEANRAQTFGHVKSEKIVNMVQYMFDLELARQPVKEPAGPNDFPRLKAVESRAKLAGFFYVNKRGGGYDYTLGTKASSLIEKLEKNLGADYEALVNFIGLMIPLDTKEAEVRATVYSAWNNLLLDGATITDEAIVYEAREAWHPDKLKIPREKFFEAIEWIKANDIVPKGNGKKVEHKTTKPNQKK